MIGRSTTRIAAAALALLGAAPAWGASFCMLAAETYYQQLYCEVTAQGRGTLPSFADFKRNSPTVQALLLKRPAKRLGIEVVPPRPSPAPAATVPEALPAPDRAAPAQTGEDALAACRLTGEAVVCGTQRFALTGNRPNAELAPGALGTDNRMALPTFGGDPADARVVRAYLHRAYQRYLERMLAIGLGGATMSYGKFAFLFQDLSAKGVDFAGRFETMYRFLKQDKAQLGAGGRIAADRQLTLADCGALGERLVVCARGGRNYVYVQRPP